MNPVLSYLFLGMLCLSSQLVFGQSWNSLTSGKSTYYVTENSDTLAWNYTTRLNTFINGDSVFSLPLYYQLCRGCTQYDSLCGSMTGNYVLETDSFLPGRKVVRTSNNDWVLGDHSLLLKNMNTLHQSWLADTALNITCEIDTVVSLSILGQSDSVRLYRLSTGDSILIGQRFGLIAFPSWYGSGTYFHLTGSREDHLGDYLPSHYDLNNWEVGDVFYYEGWAFSCIGQNPCPCSRTKTRYDILAKTETADSIAYQVQKTKFSGNYPNCFSSYYSSGYTQQNTYITTIPKHSHLGDVWLDTTSQNVDSYTNPVLFLSSFPYPEIFRCAGFNYGGLQGITFNNYGFYYPGQFTLMGNTYPLEQDLLFAVCTDSLFRQNFSDCHVMDSYLESIGFAKHEFTIPDNGSEEELKGYIKNGITQGNVLTIDNLFLLSAESHVLQDVNIYYSGGSIYAEGIPADAFPVQFVISDIFGKVVYEKQVNAPGNIFERPGLSSGVYLVKGYSTKYVIPAVKLKMGL